MMAFKNNLVSDKELISVKRRRSQSCNFDKFEPELQAKRESDGWEVDKVLKTHIRMKRAKPLDEQFEDEVWLLFAALGFSYLNRDRHLEIPYGAPDTCTNKQIDVLAIDDETILFVECKCAKMGRKANFKDEIEALNGIRQGLIKTASNAFPGRKIKFIFATKNYDVSDNDRKRMIELGIHYFDQNSIKYFSELAKHLGECARFQLLGHLFAGQKISAMDNKVPAIRGDMGGHTYYSFSIEPDKLLKISYVLHRNDANNEMIPTYQRIVKKGRLKEIQNFIDSGGFFPNCLIISIDAKKLQFDLASTQIDSSIARIGILHLPQLYRSAYIIDGQHRLYGYADSKYCATNSIPVVAFVNLDRKKQVKLFMEINENQKSVSKNLRNTLNADLLWTSDDWNEQRKALRLNIAQKLGEKPSSPLYERIIIGENEISATRCITIETIENGMRSTNFLSRYSKDNAITDNGTFDKGNNDATNNILLPFIIRCFEYFKDNLPEEWAKSDNQQGILVSNNSTHALIRIFNDIVNYLITQKKIDPINDNPDDIANEVEYYLAPLVTFFSSISEEQRKEIRSNYGSGGKSRVWRTFQRIIADSRAEFMPDGLAQWMKDNTKQYNYDSFSMIHDIERTLNKDFAVRLEAKYGARWITTGLPPKVYQQANTSVGKQNYENSSNGSGKVVSIWDCVTIANYKEIATFGSNWTELFESTYTRPSELKIPGGKAAKTEWIMKLSKIASNNSAATYSVSEQDFHFLKSIYEWLVKQYQK
jgi:DNA sulfur modification protein DndB